MLTDSHCHLDFSHFDSDRKEVLNRAYEAGIGWIIIPGVDLVSSRKAVQFESKKPKIFASVGVHPNSSTTWTSETISILKSMSKNSNVVAIGEIGLDYYRNRAPRDHQVRVLQNQLNLAEELGLPVILHTRNKTPEDRTCMKDLIRILVDWQPSRENPGVIHSFSGNLGEADRLMSMGFMIGVTGPVTYKKAMDLREVVQSVPLDTLLTETDSPYLTPHPHRGKRNEPANVKFIAERISQIKSLPLQTVIQKTSENARRLFDWE